MLVVMGHSKWPDNIGLSMSRQTSLIDDNQSAKFSEDFIKTDSRLLTTPGNDPTRKNEGGFSSSANISRKPLSGIFGIIYDQSPMRVPKKRAHHDVESGRLKSPSYVEIEKAILAGHKPQGSASSPFASHAPVVTLIDEKLLRRSGSIVSNSASIRHRGSIKRRNKIMRREATSSAAKYMSLLSSVDTETKPSKSKEVKRSRYLSVFPVRRKTSYKYNPVQRKELVSRFESQKDVDDYFQLNNVASLMRELLPNTMTNFEFKKLERLSPLLKFYPAHYEVSPEGHITRLNANQSVMSKSRVNVEQSKSSNKSSSNTYASGYRISATNSDIPELIKRRSFLGTVYTNYRRIAFAGKRPIPLKLETVLPIENKMMTESERAKLNTQLLVEILLRRTVAAKIGFRLQQSRHNH